MSSRFLQRALPLLLFICFTVGPQLSASLLERRQLVGQFLDLVPIIRVVLMSGPGFGHQSAGATVVTRLRQLGYNGHIQVVYYGDGSLFPTTPSFLPTLFPYFAPSNGAEQNFPDLNISFIARSSISKEPNDRVPLAITGAGDTDLQLSQMNATLGLELHPLNWWGRNGFNRVSLSSNDPGGFHIYEKELLSDLKTLGYVFDLPNPQDLGEFVDSNLMANEGLVGKKLGLKAILSALNSIELLPVYGHHINKHWQLVRVVRAVQRAQNRSGNLFRGGVVIPVFNNLIGPAKTEIVNEFAGDSKIQVLDVERPELADRLSRLGRGELLVVQVGSVSKPLFEYFYSMATLPPVVEGMNSINLMQLIGRPYLPSVSHEGYHFIDRYSYRKGLPGDFGVLDLLHQTFMAMTESHRAHQPEYIAQFILESLDPESDLSAVFRQNHLKDTKNYEKDKLFRGLEELLKHVQQWEDRHKIQILASRCERALQRIEIGMTQVGPE